MKSKFLWLAFVVLLGVFVFTQVFNKPPNRSFNPEFVRDGLDRADKIVVQPKDGGQTFSLVKSNEQWRVKSDQLDVEARTEIVASLIETVVKMKAERVAAKSEDKWLNYELKEGKAKSISFFIEDKKVEEIVLGKFDFNQEARKAKSYVRHLNDQNVYVVDGFLSMTLAGSPDAFRNKELISLSSDEMTRLTWSYNGQSRTIHKENYWIDESNQTVDSLAINQFILGINNLSGQGFADSFNPESQQRLSRMAIQYTTGEIEIQLFKGRSETEHFVIHSSSNPSNYFISDSTGIYQKLFGDVPVRLN